jgi:hypothetical protein
LLKHMQGSKTVNPNSQQQIPFLLGNWLSWLEFCGYLQSNGFTKTGASSDSIFF